VAQRIFIHPCDLEKRKRQIAKWNLPRSVQKEILRFLEDMALGKVNRGFRISERRQLKVLETLRIPLQFFDKPTARVTVRDVEAFEKALIAGKLKSSRSGKPYALSTRSDIRKILKMFLRWRLGEARALELAGWLDTRSPLKTPDFLSEADMERLYRACHSPMQRFMVAILFDSGARAEELHNIRLEDVCLPAGKEAFVKITLKQEYSKTLGRTISLYWKHSFEAVSELVNERMKQGAKLADPVVPQGYPAVRKALSRLGQRVLGRGIHYHLFRHSSATYYAAKLNRQELCYRFGWRFSSNMPDIYISRAGMETKELDEKFTQTQLGALQNQLVDLSQATKMKDERIRLLEETVQGLQKNFDAVSRIISLKPKSNEIRFVLQRKSRETV